MNIPIISLYANKDEIIQAESLADLPLTNSTSLQSEVRARYCDLVRLLGEPNGETDGYKVDAEWIVYTEYGVCTIYNYKDGKNYCGDEGLDIEDITEWHLGAHNKQAAEIVRQAIIKDQDNLNITIN